MTADQIHNVNSYISNYKKAFYSRRKRKDGEIPNISSNKIAESTGVTISEIETYLDNSNIAEMKFINFGQKIYKIL